LTRLLTFVEERDALQDVPNAFPYIRCIETEKAGYLIRQYLYGSLYDRIRFVLFRPIVVMNLVHVHSWNPLRNAGLHFNFFADYEIVMLKEYFPLIGDN
jgi:hypothetical protein